jgi:GH35 family endo-1,4-beta-xylanase
VHANESGRYDFFFDRVHSYDYLSWAVEAAKKAQPTIQLYYNDTNNHAASGDTTILTKMIMRQYPQIDYVGVEGHIGRNIPFFTGDDIERTLVSYRRPIIVTEMDISLHGLPREDMAGLLSKQAKAGYEFISAARKAGVRIFIFWGLDDNVSWLSLPKSWAGQGETDSDATMFDAAYRPRPYFYAVLAAFLQDLTP